MVCGCSLWMNFASCCGSAFCRASKEAASAPSALVSRSSRRLAWSGSKARCSSLRANSIARRATASPPLAMGWNSSRTDSACSAVMAGSLATSRLTFPTSSSLSCCSNCALASSPSATSKMAALRRLGSSSSDLVVFRIMAGTPAQALVLFLLADPTAQDLHRDLRFLGDLVAQVFGKDFGFLGDDGRQFERTERLGIRLGLQRVALGKLRFHLVLNLARRG